MVRLYAVSKGRVSLEGESDLELLEPEIIRGLSSRIDSTWCMMHDLSWLLQ
jgi:hypothetical protein